MIERMVRQIDDAAQAWSDRTAKAFWIAFGLVIAYNLIVWLWKIFAERRAK